MSEVQGTLFEFDQNNELHRKAQHYIETMDREVFPTLGDLMVTAIVDYFDRYYAGQDSVVSETQGDLEKIIEAACERALDKKLPELLNSALENMRAGEIEDAQASHEEEDNNQEALDLQSVEKDINWGFLGG